MTRRRLLAAAVGAGVLLATCPALGAVDRGETGGDLAEVEALALLEQAAQAGRRLTYSGTQFVATWRAGSTHSALLELTHEPGRGSVVTGADDEAAAAGTAVLDPRMLVQLGAAYSLSVSGTGRCAGRSASVIEARRSGGELAGRFWVDRDSGMLLRREVYDAQGRRVRSSAFVDVEVDARPSVGGVPVVAVGARTGSERPSDAAVQRLRALGWHVPESLREDFRLFETRLSGDVLHLAYTDGLSTLSLFVQDGRLGSRGMSGFSVQSVGGRPVWVRQEAPERVVWSGGERVWTLVSDAPHEAVLSVVGGLPRDPAPDTGMRSRLSRGLSRLAGMVNPFD